MKTNIYKMFRLVLIALTAVVAFSCQKPYEMTLPLAISRDNFTFGTKSGMSYFMVYSTSSWSISTTDDDSWIKLSTYSGSGEQQVTVSYDENFALSRGVTFKVKSGDLERSVYFSQQSGAAGDAAYSLNLTNVKLVNTPIDFEVTAISSLPEENFNRGYALVNYSSEGENWVKDVKILEDRISVSIDSNPNEYLRIARVEIIFPVATWDSAVKSELTITQDGKSPAFDLASNTTIEVDPDGLQSVNVETRVNFTPSLYPNYVLSYMLKDMEGENVSWLRDCRYNESGDRFLAAPRINIEEERQAILTFMIVDKSSGAVISDASLQLSQGKSSMGNGSIDSDNSQEPKDPEQDF